MTVAGYDTKSQLYGVVWIHDGHGHALNVSAQSLCKSSDADDLAAAKDLLSQALRQNDEVGRKLLEINEELKPLKAEFFQMKQDLLGALMASRKTIQEVSADATALQLVTALVERAETFKREGNAQIEALTKRLNEVPAPV